MQDPMRNFILPGLRYLPADMRSPEAMAMLFAIGMQESRFEYRFQIGGPARGFFQFEENGGIAGVLAHPATGDIIRGVCFALIITPTKEDCYDAVAYNDPLAVCFARLLLWTLTDSLPGMNEYDKGWTQYLAAWRPGRPRIDTWKSYFNTAWLCC